MAESKDTTPKYPGVNFYTVGGTAYAYHRKTKTRLRAPIGSPEFKAQLAALDRLLDERNDPLRGSLAGLFDQYRKSPEFDALSPRTKKDYEKIFLYLRPGAERKLLLNFRVKDAIAIRNAAKAQHKRHFANYCITVLRLVFSWAKTHADLKINPLSDTRNLKIKRPRGMPKANRRWGDFECDAVLDVARGGVKVAVALGMFAGMREGDALAATRLNYDGERLTWMQGKTGVPVRMPVNRRLKEILDETLLGRDPSQLNLVLNTNGTPYTCDGFRTMLWKLIHKLEVAGKVMPGLTFHGLRHTAGTVLADLGASPHAIAAMLGQKTLVMATLYSNEANTDRLREHAVGLLQGRRAEPDAT